MVSLSDASQQGRALPSLLPYHLTRPPRGSGGSPVGQRLTAPGKGYGERGLRGAERTGEMVRTGATPSPETDGEPRKTQRPREEIGRRGGAAPSARLGPRRRRLGRRAARPPPAPWWKRTGGWTGRGLRAWAGGAAPGGLGRGGGGPGGGRDTEYTDGKGAGGEEDQARGGGDRRTCRGPQGDSGGSHGPSAGLKAPRRVKDAGSSKAWAPAVEEKVRPTRRPRHRRISVLGGTPASNGSVSQFQNQEPRKEEGKESQRREKRSKRPLRPRVSTDPAPGPSSHSPPDVGPGARRPGGPGSVSRRGFPQCAWTGRSAPAW